jgi:hypothetical protein
VLFCTGPYCLIKLALVSYDLYLENSTLSEQFNIAARRAVSRQRLGSHVPAVTDTCAIIEVLLETVFSTRSVQRGCRNRDSWKGAAVKTGLEHGRRGIPIVGAVTRRRVVTLRTLVCVL